jgi:hypothetical protein
VCFCRPQEALRTKLKYRITIQATTKDLRHDHETEKNQARLRESTKAASLMRPRPVDDFGAPSESVCRCFCSLSCRRLTMCCRDTRTTAICVSLFTHAVPDPDTSALSRTPLKAIAIRARLSGNGTRGPRKPTPRAGS